MTMTKDLTPAKLKKEIERLNRKRGHGEGKLYSTSNGRKVGFTYQLKGKQVRVTEKAGGFNGKDPAEALSVLEEHIKGKGQVERGGRPRSLVELEKLTLAELLDTYAKSQELDGAKDLRHTRSRVKTLTARFGDMRAVLMSTAAWDAYIDECRTVERCPYRGGYNREEKRQHNPATCQDPAHLSVVGNATINRRQEVLSAAFAYARKTIDGWSHVPFLRVLPENRKLVDGKLVPHQNVRRKTFTHAMWERILPFCEQIDADAYDWLSFYRWKMLRPGQVCGMVWSALDRESWNYWIDGAVDKNDFERAIPITGEQRTVLERRLKKRLPPGTNPAEDWIFHRNGKRIRYDWIRERVFFEACRAAEIPAGWEDGFVLYDSKRNAMKTHRMAGNSVEDGMRLSGHKSKETWKRYDYDDVDYLARLHEQEAKAEDYVRGKTLPFSKDSARKDAK